jgi:ABC-type bacteriocin/lantibiotic exporter with double-glycine peptidase domain
MEALKKILDGLSNLASKKFSVIILSLCLLFIIGQRNPKLTEETTAAIIVIALFYLVIQTYLDR